MVLIQLVSGLGGAPTAWAQIDNSALPCTAEPTYFPRGDHWAVVPGTDTDADGQPDATCDTGSCDGPIPIVFEQHSGGAPGVDGFAAQDAIFRAFATWMNQTCSGGAFPNILVLDGVLLGLPDYPTRDRGDSLGFRNIIYFVIDPGSWEADSLTVALTTQLFTGDTGWTATSDMEFNAIDFDWRARPSLGDGSRGALSGCTAGNANCYDVESVALHEAGHFIGLNHVTCSDAVMFSQGAGTQGAKPAQRARGGGDL